MDVEKKSLRSVALHCPAGATGTISTPQDAVDPWSSEVQCLCCRDTNMSPIDVAEDKWLLTSPNKPGLCKGEIKLDKQGASTGTSFTIEHKA